LVYAQYIEIEDIEPNALQHYCRVYQFFTDADIVHKEKQVQTQLIAIKFQNCDIMSRLLLFHLTKHQRAAVANIWNPILLHNANVPAVLLPVLCPAAQAPVMVVTRLYNRGGGGGGGGGLGGGSNINKHGGGGRGGGRGGGGREIASPSSGFKVIFAMSEDDDLDDLETYDEEDESIKISPCKSLAEFFDKINEVHYITEDVKKVKIFNTKAGKWVPLSMEMLKSEQQSKRRVYLLDMEQFDERLYSDEEDPNSMDDYADDVSTLEADSYDDMFGKRGMHESALYPMIIDLTDTLKEEGWKLSSAGNMVKGNVTTPTKSLILEKAQNDPTLRDVLISQIGALDHIAQCLHFEFVWNRSDLPDSVD
jgi:hypothetical protein